MDEEISLFERLLTEAEGDAPPDADMGSGGGDTGPPDIPDGAQNDDGPPDMGGDEPPDMGDAGDEPPDMGDDFGMDDGSGGEGGDNGQEGGEGQENQIDGLDEKVSAIMNQQLYQKFLSMLNTISSQQNQIRSNNDILYALSPESLDIADSLSKLDENIRLYLKDIFLNENYSKNLLFFNKCLNLLNILNKIFSQKIRKGIKDAE